MVSQPKIYPPKIYPPPDAPPWEQMRAVIERLDLTTERLDLTTVLLDKIADLLKPAVVKNVKKLTWPAEEPYNIMDFDLSEARDQEELLWEGDNITASTDGTLAGITLKFESKHNNALPLQRFNPVLYPDGFTKFYLTHTAQPGRTLYLFLGRAAGASTFKEITATAPTQIFYSIKSDKDDHFTGALSQYAKEDESISGLLTSKIRILDIAIIADQPLDLWLMFWRKNTFASTDLDANAFIGAVELDMSTFSIRVGSTGPYYMSKEDINLDYDDEDKSNKLHVSLFNADSTAKTAGAAGEVVIYIKYELRG